MLLHEKKTNTSCIIKYYSSHRNRNKKQRLGSQPSYLIRRGIWISSYIWVHERPRKLINGQEIKKLLVVANFIQKPTNPLKYSNNSPHWVLACTYNGWVQESWPNFLDTPLKWASLLVRLLSFKRMRLLSLWLCVQHGIILNALQKKKQKAWPVTRAAHHWLADRITPQI